MSTNLSKMKRDKMLETIKNIKLNINDEETLKNLSLIEYELTKKKYGLVWEEHEEKVDEELKTQIPTFEEVKEKEIESNKDDKFNFLLEGDNLHSLYLLEKTHKGKIDVIYIDPPYNTGNSFVYDDNIIDSNDEYKHSKWISFMYRRINQAYKLLSNDGKLFISIDDNEQANLKLICNEIFGENNFFAQIIVQSNKRGQTYKQIAKTHEYILIYTKSEETEFNEIKKTEEDSDLNLVDEIGKYNIRELRNRNPKFGKFNRPNLFYPFYVNGNKVDKDGFSPISLEKTDEYNIEVYPYNSKGEESCWRWGTKLTLENNNFDTQLSNVVAKIKKDGNYNIYEKYRKETYKAKTIWEEVDMITEKGTVELGEHGLAKYFEFPKPVALIKKCLELGTHENSIILDFFAGSGTTGQAVLELNKEDKGKRQFILCTNNQNNICERVTYQRLKNVIKGYNDKEKINANLKYYKTAYIPRINDEELNIQDKLLSNIRSLIQLENNIKIDNKKIKVFFYEGDIDKFSENIEEVKKCEKIYISTDILLTAKQVKIFKDNNVEVYIIPEYYFENEIKEVQ